jgi:PIN domain nuclease of toxin-antitoxin system
VKCLLDTCTLIWLCGSPDRLSASACELINDAENELVISHVSFLEISLKWSAGTLILPAPPRHWLSEQVQNWNLIELPLTADDIFRISELPDIHKDPFDRLIVATAIRNDCVLITPDPQIHRFPVNCRW